MRENSQPVERRTERSDQWRKLFEFYKTRSRTYRAGFFSLLALIVVQEFDLDLSNRAGEVIKFHLNPDHTVSNQERSCK